MAESKLTDLIARLEAATEGTTALDLDLALAVGLAPTGERWERRNGYYNQGGYAHLRENLSPELGPWPTYRPQRFTTSLDAIGSLIERKFPTADYDIHHRRSPYQPTVHWFDAEADAWRVSQAATKPLAACIALLSALRQQGGSEHG